MINNLDNFMDNYNKKCSNYNYFPSILPSVRRIVVIGDIHGDMEMMLKCLKIGKLIDDDNKWIGGDSVVVQIGDQIDSCRYNGKDDCNDPNNYKKDSPNDVNILYFMTRLHKKAAKHNGAVYSLMGNHEFMNVMGDMTYVSHSNIKQFDNYKKSDGSIINNGIEARKHLFSPGNELGTFLACTRKMALIIGSNLFVHAGIVPELISKYKIDDMNKLMTLFLLNELEQPEYFKDLFMSGTLSPLWTRMFGNKIDNCVEVLQPLKDIYEVDKIYVGHTPQFKNGINSQCDKKIWLTDVGMSKAFSEFKHHRKAQVLEILDDGDKINILN